MSQIGYMFVAVGIGGYSAGMFHLMTHAFFKALLFMAAGSIISAMANMQDIDKMKGFRKAMPFTAAMLIIGALALSGFPGTSGWFSKDEIIDFAHFRGGMYDWMWVGMLIGAFMTAIYSFRIIFRILPGPACKEAEYLEQHGHVIHGEPKNPATGQVEDTEVGYPGEEHHIAEQAGGMKFAMGVLGVLALIGGLVQIPGVDEIITHFLEPTFEDSIYAGMHPSVSQAWTGLAEGALISIAGIATAWLLYIKRPDLPARFRSRFSAVHSLCVNKWYGDQVIDFLIVNPVKAFGRFCNVVFERGVINGATTGVAGITRSAGAAVRDVQSGLLRGYAVLMLFGILAIVVYFLIRSI
jgi:NADH-quinone oxidoreductase subunit L